MAVSFANAKSIVIPEGNVKQISDSLGRVIWKKPGGYQDLTYVMYPASSPNKLDTGVRGIDGNWTFDGYMNSYSTSGNVSTLGVAGTTGWYVGPNSNGWWGGGGNTSGAYVRDATVTVRRTVSSIRFVKDGTYYHVKGSVMGGNFDRESGSTTLNTGTFKVPVGTPARNIFIFSLRCVNGDNVLFDGVPKKDTSTGYCGILDNVSGTFFGFPDWTGA